MSSFKEALEVALNSTKTITKSEEIAIEDALTRIVSEDIYALRDLPPFNNSAMDGYVFKYQEKAQFKIAGSILAGDKEQVSVASSECYKIMTGAVVPNSCDTVIPVELTTIKDGYLYFDGEVKKGNAIRLKGEELTSGKVLLQRGEILTPAKIALLASQGIVKVNVYKKLKIAIASTGNELKEPHEEAQEGEIYNINAINIKMHLTSLGFKADYLGSIPDDFDEAKAFIAKFKEYDIAITSGGISKGDADYTKEAFFQNDLEVIFAGVKVKPGHPTLFGTMQDTFVMALPGNPLAAIVNLLLLGVPTLLKTQGAKEYYYKTLRVKMVHELKLKSGRSNIVLGEVKDGYFSAYKNNKYGSGMITPLSSSNAITVFDENNSTIKKDREIEVVLINHEAFCDELKFIN